jgi:hypothetical protein
MASRNSIVPHQSGMRQPQAGWYGPDWQDRLSPKALLVLVDVAIDRERCCRKMRRKIDRRRPGPDVHPAVPGRVSPHAIGNARFGLAQMRSVVDLEQTNCVWGGPEEGGVGVVEADGLAVGSERVHA